MKLLCFSVFLAICLSGCAKPPGQNSVTWELEGDDVRVIESFVDREGDRRHFFPAASIEAVSSSGHVVSVSSNGESFEVICFDAEQAGQLVDVLQAAMKKAAGTP